MSRWMIPSLIAVAASMTTIAWEVQTMPQYGADITPGSPTRSNVAPSTAVSAPADPVDAWVATSLERPLVRESRRPDRVTGAERSGDDPPRLAGVVTGPFGDRAIFVLAGTGKPVVVKVGTQLADFVVRSIEPGRVVVVANGVARTYRPFVSLAATSRRSS